MLTSHPPTARTPAPQPRRRVAAEEAARAAEEEASHVVRASPDACDLKWDKPRKRPGFLGRMLGAWRGIQGGLVAVGGVPGRRLRRRMPQPCPPPPPPTPTPHPFTGASVDDSQQEMVVVTLVVAARGAVAVQPVASWPELRGVLKQARRRPGAAPPFSP